MIKGLEAYEIVKEECDFAFGGTANGDRVRKNLPIIEKELKRLEEIDEVLNTGGGIWAETGIVSKKLKSLEIIKNKGVNVGEFKDMLEDWKDITFEKYLYYREENGYELQNDYDFETNPLIEEEFELLKEVLL